MVAALLATAGLNSACDLGPRDDAPAHGSPLHLVATYPADGQGTSAASDARLDCDTPTPDCPVPTNPVFELRFDRFLLPSGLAGGLRVFTGNTANSVALLGPEYDLIERVVVFRSGRTLEPNTLYTAEVLPTTDQNQGFWAFDGAPLERGPVPFRFSFSTGSGPVTVTAPPAAPAETCDSLVEGPLASCAHCHTTAPGPDTASEYPPMGLDLSSAAGLSYTAIAHVAHQAETGDTAANTGLESPPRFGVQMNVVDPGFPATSYLMYKLLEKPENFRLDSSEPSCLTGYHAPVSEAACQPPSEAEITQLREWFVRGEGMPKDRFLPGMPATSATASISHASLLRIARWIASGASCAVP